MKLKIMKILFYLWLLLIYLPIVSQHQVDPYLEIAANHNPELKASFNDFMASLELAPQARGLDDPRITFGYFIQPVETRVGAQRASIGLNQTFPWFGTLKAKENLACQMIEARYAEFLDTKLKLYRDVRVAYNELYFLHQAIRLTANNLQVLNSFKELARVNFESGKTGFVSVLRVEMEEQELRTKLDYLKDSQKSAETIFENLLNTRLEKDITFPDSLALVLLDYPQQSLVDSLLQNNLQLQELKYQALAKEEQVEVARMMSKPSLSVGLNYIFVDERSDLEVPDNGRNAFLFPQVGMSIPIFQKKYQAMQNQAVLNREKLDYQIEHETNQLFSQLELLIRDHVDAQRRLKLNQNLHHLAERSLSLLQTEFTTGQTEFEEVLRMERKLLTYQLELERARVDINNAVYNINYLIGNENY
jgi:outer membrane protein TolC